MINYRIREIDLYERNIAVLKRFTDVHFKIVHYKALRKSGYEHANENTKSDTGKKNTADNKTKFVESVSRTRSKVYEIAVCNEWEFFITLTLNQAYRDRNDSDTFRMQLTKWINNYNSRHGVNIRYIIIPEKHKDGAFHAHGFFSGIPIEHLAKFRIGENVPLRLLNSYKTGRDTYNWPAYADAFGFITLERIVDKVRSANYILKYIGKDLGGSGIGLNRHLYYCSKNLKRAETVYKGSLRKEFTPDYKNDYVAVKTVNSFEEGISYFHND